MTARDLRTVLAGVCLIGCGLLSNFFKGINAEKWMTFSMIGTSLAAIYIGLDLLISTEKSLLYRITRAQISVEYHQMGGCMLVFVFSILTLLMVAKLANLFP